MGRPDRLELYRRRYAALKPGWEPATARYQQRVATHLAEGHRVLDLGCGRGGIVERLSYKGRWAGIDPDLVSLQEHRQASLDRCCGVSERLPFADESFDVVVASWLLEHLATPLATFEEIARVLKEGGSFFFLTPNLKHPLLQFNSALARMQGLQRKCIQGLYGRSVKDTFPVHYRANVVHDIEQLAVRSGLRLREVICVGDPTYLAFDSVTFVVAVGIEALLPASWKVHLIGHFVRPISGRYCDG
ncbi:MAG: class I SAM-dependent methyltransferase [Anaerolineae bacterium]